MVKGVGARKEFIERFSNQGNRRLLAKSLRGMETKSTKNYILIDPASKQLLSGNLSQLSKQIGVSPATIKNRVSKGKNQFKDVKGFQVLSFKDEVQKVNFMNDWDNQDAKVLKKKSKPILSGAKYLESLKENFTIKDDGFTENKNWGTAEHTYNLDINSEGLTKNQLEQVFAQTSLDTIKKQKLKSKDKIRVVVKDPNLKSGFVSIPLMDVKDFSVGKVFKVFEEVVESNEDYEISSFTTLHFISVKMPQDFALGSYEPSKHKLNKDMKKSIIQIKNKDDLCVARAVATGILRIEEGVNSKDYDNAKRGRKIQEIKAKELLEEAGIPQRRLHLDDIRNLESYTGYQITIIDGDDYNNVLYPDIEDKHYIAPFNDDNTIYLYKHEGHCDLIANNRVAGFFGKENFCHKCKKCYKKKGLHKCKFKCNICCNTKCDSLKLKHKTYKIECQDCNRFFPTQMCFNNHLETNKKGECVCSRVWKCQDCKKVLSRDTQPPETHQCGDYLCPNCKRVVHKDHKCFMYPKKIKEPSENYIFFDFECDISGKHHEVMYSVSMSFNDPTPIIHHNIDEFCAYCLDNKNHTFIAHNGKGYDYQFIVRWVYANTDYQPFIIFNGSKINYMSIKELNIRFIDSLSFITRPLKDFPKIFGETELKKGFFPHWFNTKENWNYIGKMPPADKFKYNSFKEKDRKEFIKWYGKKVKEKYIWEQKKEMEEYCISDVDILRKCCIKFRQLYLDVGEIDPFQYLTIASVCMSIYKYHFIDKSFPYRQKLFDEIWTGDPSKYDDDKREEYNEAKKQFTEDTHEIIEREKKIGIIPFQETHFIRQSFFGGRTNATKLLYNFQEGEEGKYKDITSLYPTVNYFDEYPLGHYEILNNEYCQENQDIVMESLYDKEFFGFIDCLITSPTDLYHPVLPKKGEKLVFDLIKKRGVWCSNELYNAIDKGYKVEKVFEVRYYKETTKDLFKDYVAKFLKIKQEASGYPDWVENDEDKEKYIADYHLKQGIKMDKDKIVENPGLRAIAKLCLNSLWGKFGQRTNLTKNEIVKTKEELYKIIFNETYEDINWIDISDDKLQVSYKVKDKFVENDYNTSIAVASFTTASARCRLYTALEKLQRQVLYFDTDSVVYKWKEGEEDLEIGDLLGDWTDELEGKKMIGTFVSGGPKNYSYETDDGKYHTKVKGFSLNYEVSQKINHLSMIKLVKGVLEDTTDTSDMNNKEYNKYMVENHKIGVEYNGIKRGKGHTLENIHQEKNYGLVYTKRSICPVDELGNYDTLPFGYFE
tara:strand:- start:3166 stop:6990 length:3825 start_codon:yes stop_codon:yes gene_type:complete